MISIRDTIEMVPIGEMIQKYQITHFYQNAHRDIYRPIGVHGGPGDFYWLDTKPVEKDMWRLRDISPGETGRDFPKDCLYFNASYYKFEMELIVGDCQSNKSHTICRR